MTPGEKSVGAICAYLEELHGWNRRANLSGLKTRQDMALKHVGDTVLLARALDPGIRTVLDIGTGAGIPGLILKLLLPHLEVVLVDALRKRISFLRTVIALLDISGVWAEQGRVGSDPVPSRVPDGGFDLVVSQAVGAIDELARLAEPLLARQGKVISMKGPGAAMELESAGDALRVRGWTVTPVKADVPVTGHSRTLVTLTRT
jgi:16S rRNA (guanine527-N7)-methyltransferase